MAYFPNGTSHAAYEEKFCDHCRHQKPDDGGCPIMAAHMIYNYDQCSDEQLKSVLSILIPTEDITNLQCAMFTPLDPGRCVETKDMFSEAKS